MMQNATELQILTFWVRTKRPPHLSPNFSWGCSDKMSNPDPRVHEVDREANFVNDGSAARTYANNGAL